MPTLLIEPGDRLVSTARLGGASFFKGSLSRLICLVMTRMRALPTVIELLQIIPSSLRVNLSSSCFLGNPLRHFRSTPSPTIARRRLLTLDRVPSAALHLRGHDCKDAVLSGDLQSFQRQLGCKRQQLCEHRNSSHPHSQQHQADTTVVKLTIASASVATQLDLGCFDSELSVPRYSGDFLA